MSVDGGRLTVAAVLIRLKANSVQDINQILALLIYLDVRLIELLIKLLESAYFRLLQDLLIIIGKPKEPGLLALADPLFKYFQIINELEDYLNKHSPSKK